MRHLALEFIHPACLGHLVEGRIDRRDRPVMTTSFLPSGTFCSLDICLAQLEELGTLNVFQTVSRMRTQRAFSIQTPEQYYFCYKAILEFAEREGMVPSSHNLLAMEGQ